MLNVIRIVFPIYTNLFLILEIDPNNVEQLAIWKRSDLGWQFSVQEATQTVIAVDADSKANRIKQVVVSSVNRYGEESARSSVTIE